MSEHQDRRLVHQGEVMPPVAPTITTATPWQVVVDAFLAAAMDSANTRRAYQRHLYGAFHYFELAVKTVADISGADLAQYRASITSSELSPSSQAQALAALRSFLTWSRSMGAHALPADVIATALRTPKASVQKPYQTVTETEIAAMLEIAATARDRAILAVMLGAGLRAAEVAGLDVGDIHEDGDGEVVLHVRQGKGRKDRQVPVQDDVAQLLRVYLHQTGRRLGGSGPLFRAHDRGAGKRGQSKARLSTRGIGALVERVTRRAGVRAKTISPHSLRHSFALRSLRGGASVVAVSRLLGHASISTTQRYVDHLGLDELRQAVPRLPRAGGAGKENGANR